MAFFIEKLKRGLKKTADQISQSWNAVINYRTTPEIDFNKLEETLLLADISLQTTENILKTLKSRIESNSSKSNDSGFIVEQLRQILVDKLQINNQRGPLSESTIILLVGVNGVGKTTTAGKLAHQLTHQGRSVTLVAADTFRAAAEEQLTQWASRVKVDIVKGLENEAPATIIYKVLKNFSERTQTIIIDTAGRLHTRVGLMEELKKLVRVAEKMIPLTMLEKWIVLDANMGQNAIHQVEEFHQGIGLTGIVLTKVDGTAKGGIVISLADRFHIPIVYLGVGETMDDIIPFDAQEFVSALLPKAG
jgi:fused signal recognition particle receptor